MAVSGSVHYHDASFHGRYHIEYIILTSLHQQQKQKMRRTNTLKKAPLKKLLDCFVSDNNTNCISSVYDTLFLKVKLIK